MIFGPNFVKQEIRCRICSTDGSRRAERTEKLPVKTGTVFDSRQLNNMGLCPVHRDEKMYLKTTGLILRDVDYSETSRMLTLLTMDEGKLSASAKGARRKGSKTAAATQFLSYSEFVLSGSHGRWTVSEARTLEEFRGLREYVTRLSLGAYFAELLETVSDEDYPNPRLLAHGLNGLYVLSQGRRPEKLVKAAFELRLMCLAGYAPAVECCHVCGKKPEEPYFDFAGGTVCCKACRSAGPSAPLENGAYDALCHIVSAEPKKIYSFTLGDGALKSLGGAAERYVQAQFERGFGTLDFYKSLI